MESMIVAFMYSEKKVQKLFGNVKMICAGRATGNVLRFFDGQAALPVDSMLRG